jgi:phage gp36-like protein
MSTISYVTVDEFIDVVSVNEAVELSDLWDPLNNMVDTVRISNSLISASREVDSYIRHRYTTPIIPTPWELKRVVVVISRYRMSNLDRDSRIRLDYEDAVKWLRMVAQGQVGLDILSSDIPAAPEQRVRQVIGTPQDLGTGYLIDLTGYADGGRPW